MNEEPDIVRMLREAEKLGGLWAKTTNNVVELEVMKEPVEETSEETTRFVKDDVGGKAVEGDTIHEESKGALPEIEDRYRDLFENVNDMIQSVGPDGSFLYVNRAWKEKLGYCDKEIENLSIFDIIHPDSKEHCMEIFKRIMSGENIDSVEATFVTKGGKGIFIEGSVNCLFKDGRPVSTRGIFRDVTKRKKAEEKLNAKIAELEHYKKVTVGRELKMTELKNRINELEDKLGEYEYIDIPKKMV